MSGVMVTIAPDQTKWLAVLARAALDHVRGAATDADALDAIQAAVRAAFACRTADDHDACWLDRLARIEAEIGASR